MISLWEANIAVILILKSKTLLSPTIPWTQGTKSSCYTKSVWPKNIVIFAEVFSHIECKNTWYSKSVFSRSAIRKNMILLKPLTFQEGGINRAWMKFWWKIPVCQNTFFPKDHYIWSQFVIMPPLCERKMTAICYWCKDSVGCTLVSFETFPSELVSKKSFKA